MTVPVKSLLSDELGPHVALSAKQRYGIAASVALSVLHLSGSPWLGDRWDEEQVRISLERSAAGREMLARHPCAAYRFATPEPPEQISATPEQPEQISVTPEPPEQTAADFKHLIPNRTVFAVGILLIELCVNRPFEELRRNRRGGDGGDGGGGDASATTLLDDYQVALSRLDEVYRLAGDSYGYAAERCVKFSFQGRYVTKNFDFAQFRQQFHDTVVAPVQATYLMMPDSCIPG